ncbi:uncharacterized [Tachysurus ichikawai]
MYSVVWCLCEGLVPEELLQAGVAESVAAGRHLHRFPHGFTAQRTLKAPLGLLQELIVVAGHCDCRPGEADRRHKADLLPEELLENLLLLTRSADGYCKPPACSLPAASSLKPHTIVLLSRRSFGSETTNRRAVRLGNVSASSCYCCLVFGETRPLSISMNTDSLLWTKAPAPICLGRTSHAYLRLVGVT